MTQFEFYKSFLFVIELLFGEILYVHRLRHRNMFPLRLILWAAACFLFAFAFPILSQSVLYSFFTFLMIFVFSFVGCCFVFKERFLTVLFCCLAGYTTQHLSYEIYNIVLNILNADLSVGFYGSGDFTGIFPNLLVFAAYLFVYVMTYFLCYIFFARKIDPQESIDIHRTFIFIFTIFLLLIDIFLNAIVVYFPLKGAENGQIYIYMIGLYNILCCCVSLYLQFEVAMRRKIEMDFAFMQQMWNKTKEQYTLSKENIEYINIKFHDIKHQIRHLSEGDSIDHALLKDLEKRIDIYDSVTKTGNEALDVILTDKSMICSKNNILLTYIIDGEKLNFMSEEDVYALFGNIIDNAIEAVREVEEAQRVINLHVKKVNNMIVIRETNYFTKNIVFENGLPRTTQSDTRYHGFGVKSIRYICDKYGGSCTFTAEDGVFRLDIVLFPPEE